ncbi:MAG: M48 family metallopeptidase, partial [Nodosilinea sp.]
MAQLPMVEDPEIRTYVNDLGQKLAALTGRQEFDYRFEVIMDDSLNAFALPGGKVFIHAGAIVKSNSEAELAGLLGHEIAHAVLSHGLQMVTRGNLMNSLADLIPIREVAGIAAALVVSGYSRDMERQADVLGTRVLAMADYAADGLHNLMLTLEKEYGNQTITWFASHPNPQERISYLKQLVDQGGFSRYAYEGVNTHLQMRRKMAGLLQDLQPDSPRGQGG